MTKILDIEVGEKHLCDHQNGGEISPGELCHSVFVKSNRNGYFATRDKRHRIRVTGSG